MTYRGLHDIQIGEIYESEVLTVTKQDIITFAQNYDPQVMHLDENAAQETIFKTLVASGWHILSLSMRLVVRSKPFGETPLVGVAVDDIRFRKKVLPDTQIYCKATIVEVTKIDHKNYGHVTLSVETFDKISHMLLLSQKWTLLVPEKK